MSYEIKVTCSAETPIASKFAQFEALARNAQDYLADVKSECEPIISNVGKAKYEAILAQIAPIAQSAQKLCVMKDDCINLYGCGKVADLCVKVHRTSYEIYFNTHNPCRTTFLTPFNFDHYEKQLCGADGLLTHWNEYNIIEQLENSLTDQYTTYINSLTDKVREIEKVKNDMLH